MVDMTSVLRRVLFTLRQLSWQAQIGIWLWIAACLLALMLVSTLTKQRDLEASLAQPAQKTVLAHKLPLKRADTVQHFYALLPKISEVDALSERILQEADSIGLQFERAEFSEVKNTESSIVQHQIKLPVRGNYVQIRQFLNALFNTQAALALSEFNVRRDDVFTNLVEANLVLTLYLRGDAK